jgi:hypothetical protein
MEGSVLSFLQAEWKVSNTDTGSAHWASSYYYNSTIFLIFTAWNAFSLDVEQELIIYI